MNLIKRAGKLLKVVLLNLLIFAVLLELSLIVLARAGYINVSLPSYSVDYAKPFWADNNPHWGVWHNPNATVRHLTSCFDVTYRSNKYGMRDTERQKQSNVPRVVVLGDSFAEGWGVDDHQRLTNILQEKTGIPHLNFGTAGSFGTTQAFVLYRELASQFDHDAIVWLILPANDFADDTPTPSKLMKGARWRPYFAATDTGYEIIYPDGEFKEKTRWAIFRRNLPLEFLMTARAYYHYRTYFDWSQQQKEIGVPLPTAVTGSAYYDFTDDQYARMAQGIRELKKLAGERPVTVVTIPRPADVQRLKAEQVVPPLRSRLEKLASSLGIDYVDLLANIDDEDTTRHFIPCDGHWTHEGNLFAAQRIADADFYQTIESNLP